MKKQADTPQPAHGNSGLQPAIAIHSQLTAGRRNANAVFRSLQTMLGAGVTRIERSGLSFHRVHETTGDTRVVQTLGFLGLKGVRGGNNEVHVTTGDTAENLAARAFSEVAMRGIGLPPARTLGLGNGTDGMLDGRGDEQASTTALREHHRQHTAALDGVTDPSQRRTIRRAWSRKEIGGPPIGMYRTTADNRNYYASVGTTGGNELPLPDMLRYVGERLGPTALAGAMGVPEGAVPAGLDVLDTATRLDNPVAAGQLVLQHFKQPIG